MPTMSNMQQMMPQNTQSMQMPAARPQSNYATQYAEINPASPYGEMQGYMPGFPPNAMPGLEMESPVVPPRTLEFSTGLSPDAIESPTSSQEAYLGSLKALLAKNVGHYVVATFLVGTQSPVSWEGFLHSVGNDYLVIFQPDQGRYITGDFYALKFVEFHDTAGVVPSCAGYRRRDGQKIW